MMLHQAQVTARLLAARLPLTSSSFLLCLLPLLMNSSLTAFGRAAVHARGVFRGAALLLMRPPRPEALHPAAKGCGRLQDREISSAAESRF